jgi:hypothetical protein
MIELLHFLLGSSADKNSLPAHPKLRQITFALTLYLPRMPSGQVRRHARTRGGCRRGGHVGVCSDGRAGAGR